MEEKRVTFIIRRQNSRDEKASGYDSYSVDVSAGMTILEALISIQENQDPSLSFRYSCRGAVCGACALVINGRILLACRTQVLYLNANSIKIEPLPNMQVIKDLVVDMEDFWKKYEFIKPWLEPDALPPAKERPMSEDVRVKVDSYANCILCGSCYGACPVPGRSGTADFLGPAALAKNFRFYADSREGGRFERLERVDSQQGLWGCDTVYKCVDVCPKEVRPTDGIVDSRKKLLAGKLFGAK